MLIFYMDLNKDEYQFVEQSEVEHSENFPEFCKNEIVLVVPEFMKWITKNNYLTLNKGSLNKYIFDMDHNYMVIFATEEEALHKALKEYLVDIQSVMRKLTIRSNEIADFLSSR